MSSPSTSTITFDEYKPVAEGFQGGIKAIYEVRDAFVEYRHAPTSSGKVKMYLVVAEGAIAVVKYLVKDASPENDASAAQKVGSWSDLGWACGTAAISTAILLITAPTGAGLIWGIVSTGASVAKCGIEANRLIQGKGSPFEQPVGKVVEGLVEGIEIVTSIRSVFTQVRKVRVASRLLSNPMLDRVAGQLRRIRLVQGGRIVLVEFPGLAISADNLLDKLVDAAPKRDARWNDLPAVLDRINGHIKLSPEMEQLLRRPIRIQDTIKPVPDGPAFIAPRNY